METPNELPASRVPWNKGKLTGQKPPLKLAEIWAIRTRPQMATSIHELALFNLAIDSKLRACDLTRLLVQDVCQGSHVGSRAMVMQQKTQRPVQFEITEHTRQSIEAWIKVRGLRPTDYLFPSRLHASAHISTRQYARLVHRWIASIALDDTAYGTHTMRRTKASLISKGIERLQFAGACGFQLTQYRILKLRISRPVTNLEQAGSR
ncbi:tyrosine-type recombinase/integrase [Cupriavidus necator]|uniref:tyrosine-type recombinase/integrase n=1 Tax=Cupriavidus necator TaxID=106590 RepID=UPI00339D6AF4